MTEIHSALSESLKVGDTDSELEEELQEILNDNVPNTSLPSIPDSELADLEKELRLLDLTSLYTFPFALH